VVTADGEVRIANACTNPDLFWALKGGGGGSFGVVTRLTLKTYELADRAGAAIFTVKAMSGPALRALIGKFISFYTERLFNLHWGGRIAFLLRNAVVWDGVVWSRQGGGAAGVPTCRRASGGTPSFVRITQPIRS
jgi:FAD/FMN-containing dehydrogenase